MPLPAADDLFSTQEERDEAKREYVADIPLIEISDFPNHPYKVKQDESMLELAASIREKGVVNPALVRPKPEGGYEMVAGHRRKFASELAGKAVMPCIVRNLTDDEATIIMVDSTLIYLICVLRYTINRIGKIRQNKIRYKGIMTDTLPSIFPPI